MKGLIFTLLTFIVGAVIGLGLEKAASYLPQQLDRALTHVYGLGIAPLSLHLSLCGAVGLVLGYLIIVQFVRK